VTVNSHENYYHLSTASASLPDRPIRYATVEEAVVKYLELRVALEGAPALDPEKASMNVQTQPSRENPATLFVSDIQMLEQAFSYGRARCRASALKSHRTRDCVQWTREQLAELVGVTAFQVATWEKKGRFGRKEAELLATALGREPDDLLRPLEWRVWVAVRVHNCPLRKAHRKVKKDKAARYRDNVDRWIGQWLAGNNLMYHATRGADEQRQDVRRAQDEARLRRRSG
jgi:hypothetical protein